MRILAHALLLFTLGSSKSPQAPSVEKAISSTEQVAIRSAYGSMAHAFEQHHPERMRRFLAATFIETRQGSETARGREQFLHEIAEECKHARAPIHVRFELGGFNLDGSDVLVDVDEDTTYQVLGKDRRIHAVEYRQRSRDRWIQQSGNWKCVRESDEIPYSIRLDDRDVTLHGLTELLP